MGLFDKFKKKKTATETMEYLSTEQGIQKNGNDVEEFEEGIYEIKKCIDSCK